jgi:hypothetical protein
MLFFQLSDPFFMKIILNLHLLQLLFIKVFGLLKLQIHFQIRPLQPYKLRLQPFMFRMVLDILEGNVVPIDQFQLRVCSWMRFILVLSPGALPGGLKLLDEFAVFVGFPVQLLL